MSDSCYQYSKMLNNVKSLLSTSNPLLPVSNPYFQCPKNSQNGGLQKRSKNNIYVTNAKTYLTRWNFEVPLENVHVVINIQSSLSMSKDSTPFYRWPLLSINVQSLLLTYSPYPQNPNMKTHSNKKPYTPKLSYTITLWRNTLRMNALESELRQDNRLL